MHLRTLLALVGGREEERNTWRRNTRRRNTGRRELVRSGFCATGSSSVLVVLAEVLGQVLQVLGRLRAEEGLSKTANLGMQKQNKHKNIAFGRQTERCTKFYEIHDKNRFVLGKSTSPEAKTVHKKREDTENRHEL